MCEIVWGTHRDDEVDDRRQGGVDAVDPLLKDGRVQRVELWRRRKEQMNNCRVKERKE